MKSNSPLIIAHRGASHDAPENTLTAVNLAWAQDADAVEVDVHLSRDGQIIVMHDDNTKRTTGLDKKINELTLFQLRKLDAGSWRGNQWQGEKIPTLSEVLDTLPADKKIVIEVKNSQSLMMMIPRLSEMNNISPEQIVLMDFNFSSVVWAQKNIPQYTVLWLIELNRATGPNDYQSIINESIKKTTDAGLTGLNLEFDPSLDEGIVHMIRQAGLDLYVWTVDDPIQARRLVNLGVEGITTNRPGWLRKNLDVSKLF